MQGAAREQLPIRTVASLTGVNAVTLRAWERRYGLIRPLRTAKGHRLYTPQHVELIRRVLALLERGVPISRARGLIDAEPTPRESTPRGPWRDYVERMASAIARFDESDLDRVYDEALSTHAVDRVTGLVVMPLLVRLGERWEKVDGGVAEEHFFATYLRSKLGARLQHLMRYAAGPCIVAACAPGEHHEIGLLMFALEAQLAGMRIVVLGANTPLEDMAVAQRRSRSAAIVVSSSVDPSSGFVERALPKLVRDADVPVFVGGSTAVRHRAVIAAAGAIPLGNTVENGVRLIAATLKKRSEAS